MQRKVKIKRITYEDDSIKIAIQEEKLNVVNYFVHVTYSTMWCNNMNEIYF